MKSILSKIVQNLKIVDIILIVSLIFVGLYFIVTPVLRGNEVKQLLLIVGDEEEYLKWSDSLIDLNMRHGRDVSIEVKDGKARVIRSSCADKICIKAGWVSKCGDMAVCLPNSVALTVECSKGDYDISQRYSK